MPGPRVEGAVKVRDEAVLGEVKFDLTEELREHEAPELYAVEAAGFAVLGLRGCERFAAGSLSSVVVALPVGGVGASFGIRLSKTPLGAVCVGEIPKVRIRSSSAFFAPARPSPAFR